MLYFSYCSQETRFLKWSYTDFSLFFFQKSTRPATPRNGEHGPREQATLLYLFPNPTLLPAKARLLIGWTMSRDQLALSLNLGIFRTGKLSIRENLVITSPYDLPSVQTLEEREESQKSARQSLRTLRVEVSKNECLPSPQRVFSPIVSKC